MCPERLCSIVQERDFMYKREIKVIAKRELFVDMIPYLYRFRLIFIIRFTQDKIIA